MLKFIFFNKLPFRQFLDLAQEINVKTCPNNDDESITAGVYRDIDVHNASITTTPRDDRNIYAKVASLLLEKVLQCISNKYLNVPVNPITEAVENPDGNSLCQR